MFAPLASDRWDRKAGIISSYENSPRADIRECIGIDEKCEGGCIRFRYRVAPIEK
jgi:hypothetical protein